MRKQKAVDCCKCLSFYSGRMWPKAEESQEIPQEAAASEEYSYKEQREESYDFEAESIAGLYRDIYDRAAETGTVGTEEVIEVSLKGLGNMVML